MRWSRLSSDVVRWRNLGRARGRRQDVTVFGRWFDATSRDLVEDQGGRAPHESWVSSDALPESGATLSQGNSSVGRVFAQRVFLASADVVGPVTGVCELVVEQSTDAVLFDGGAVPAGPVTGAAGLVTEDAVLPLAVVGGDRMIPVRSTRAVHVPRISAVFLETAAAADEDESVGTVANVGDAFLAQVIFIAVALVSQESGLRVARISRSPGRSLLLLLLLLLAVPLMMEKAQHDERGGGTDAAG